MVTHRRYASDGTNLSFAVWETARGAKGVAPASVAALRTRVHIPAWARTVTPFACRL